MALASLYVWFVSVFVFNVSPSVAADWNDDTNRDIEVRPMRHGGPLSDIGRVPDQVG